MNFSEFEHTVNRICTMSELLVHKEKDGSLSWDEKKAQRLARDDVVRDLINWAKEKAQL